MQNRITLLDYGTSIDIIDRPADQPDAITLGQAHKIQGHGWYVSVGVRRYTDPCLTKEQAKALLRTWAQQTLTVQIIRDALAEPPAERDHGPRTPGPSVHPPTDAAGITTTAPKRPTQTVQLTRTAPPIHVPTLINHQAVIGAIPVPAGHAERCHQWIVMCHNPREKPGTDYTTWLAGCTADHQTIVAFHGNPGLSAADAYADLIARAARRWPVPPQPATTTHSRQDADPEATREHLLGQALQQLDICCPDAETLLLAITGAPDDTHVEFLGPKTRTTRT